jgi:hypothetical protein
LTHTWYDHRLLDVDLIHDEVARSLIPLTGKSDENTEVLSSAPPKKPDLVVNGKDWWLKKNESMAELQKRAGMSSAVIEEVKSSAKGDTKEEKAKKKKEHEKKMEEQKKKKEKKEKAKGKSSAKLEDIENGIEEEEEREIVK